MPTDAPDRDALAKALPCIEGQDLTCLQQYASARGWCWGCRARHAVAPLLAAERAAREAAEREVERHRDALLRKGYRESCSIPACNCGDQWTHGGHASERLEEISTALGELSNGRTLLAAVQMLVDEYDAARAAGKGDEG